MLLSLPLPPSPSLSLLSRSRSRSRSRSLFQLELEARIKNFHADVLLVFANCREYNKLEPIWCTYADEKERDANDLLLKLRGRVKRVLSARPESPHSGDGGIEEEGEAA